MTATYDYSIQNAFPNHRVNSGTLTTEIAASPIVTAISHIGTAGDVCTIAFKEALSNGDKTLLDGVIAAHDGAPDAPHIQPVMLSAAAGTPLAVSTDGRLVSRNTIATPGLGTHLRCFNFKTAKLGSLVNNDPFNVPYGDCDYKMFGANGVETQVEAEAVETRLEFEAPYNQEIVGGGIIIDPTLLLGSSDAWWAAAIAAPHIPAEYGGQVAFVSKINLEMLIDGYLDIDGRSTMFVPHDSYYHSGLIRFTFWHPAGVQKRMLVYLETFR